MKTTYQIFYGIAGILFIIVLFGGNLTENVFTGFSTRTMEQFGVRKTSIDSVDNRIDEVYYTVNKVQLQIEKVKNIFSDKEIDESKFQKVKHETLNRNLYQPIIGVLNYFYRGFYLLISVLFLFAGITSQMIYRNKDLRRRVTELEKIVLKEKPVI